MSFARQPSQAPQFDEPSERDWLEGLLDDRDCERCCNCDAHLVQRGTSWGHGAVWICPVCAKGPVRS